MLRINKQNNKFKQAIVISIFLHIILFVLLIWNSFNKYINIPANNSSFIESVMTDLDTIVKNYNYQQKQQANNKCTEKYYETHLQEVIKEQIKRKEKPEKETIKVIDNKIRVQDNEITKTAKEDTFNTIKDVALKNPVSRKIVAVSEINDLSDELRSNNNLQEIRDMTKRNNMFSVISGNTRQNNVSSTDISNYAERIKSEIENCFYDISSYLGKTCTLFIKLAPNGMLLDIKSKEGDIALCNAALAATHQAKMPKPPSQSVYEIFKNILLDFKP